MRDSKSLVRIFTRISKRVYSNLPPKYLASSSTVMNPLWLSSSSSQALRTLVKLVCILILISCSSAFTFTAIYVCPTLNLESLVLRWLPLLLDPPYIELIEPVCFRLVSPFSSELESEAFRLVYNLAVWGKKFFMNRSWLSFSFLLKTVSVLRNLSNCSYVSGSM